MCDCVERLNEGLKQYNTVLDEVSMLNMETGACRQSLQITTQKLERKKGKPKIVLPTYCPFCGIRCVPVDTALSSKEPL